jgi:putative two-component system response regulator
MSGEPILCVDDDEQIRGLIAHMVRSAGHDCTTVGNVDDARQLLAEQPFSVVLCDIGLPGQSGLELLEELARTRPDVATVMVTGRDDPAIADIALSLGAYGYLTKPFARNELLIDLANALRRRRLEAERREYETKLEQMVAARTAQLEQAYTETVKRLGRAIDYHDGVTGEHVERVSAHAHRIALSLGLDRERADLVRLASPLHDVGKIAIPAAILGKPEPLSPDERLEMERHTEFGYDLLADSGSELLDLAATVARTHHERWDGGGYPRRLQGEEIPLEGRIVAVADVYDALTSDRPYRAALPVGEARAFLVQERGKAFDPRVVDAFLGGAE